MNFSVPKKSLFNNNVDTVLAIENRLWRDDSLSEAEKNNVRKQVAHVLDKHPWHKDEEQLHHNIVQTIQQIKRRNNIIITKADKGNVTVIMDRSDYNKKISTMLFTFPYKIIKKDPTLSYENSIKSTISHLYNSNKISLDLLKYLKPFNSKCPHFYGCPKSHKKDFPLRPIVDF